MTLHDLQARVGALRPDQELEMDDLAFEWIEIHARDCGRDGKVALKLLKLVKELLEA